MSSIDTYLTTSDLVLDEFVSSCRSDELGSHEEAKKDVRSMSFEALIACKVLLDEFENVGNGKDYSLWKLILNGDLPPLTRIVDGVVQIVAPTTVEQRYVVPTGRVVVPTGRGTYCCSKGIKGIYEMLSKLEGLHKGYDRMQNILSQLNKLKSKPEDEDINLKFLRALPSSWSQPEQQLAYKDFEQIEKLDPEEMDLKYQMAMLSVRVHKFEQKVGRKIDFDKKESARFNKKKEEYSKALITIDTLVDWTDHDSKSDGVIAAKEFSMIDGCDFEDAIEEDKT
nr:hypothetical protein [Tanacetum cinerariifolium]